MPVRQGIGTVLNFVFERTSVYLDYRLLVERTNSELILMRFADPSPGIWRIVVEPQQLADGIFHIWLPVAEFLTGDVYFLQSNPDTTITEPGNTPDPMTVASYNGQIRVLPSTREEGILEVEDLSRNSQRPE